MSLDLPVKEDVDLLGLVTGICQLGGYPLMAPPVLSGQFFNTTGLSVSTSVPKRSGRW